MDSFFPPCSGPLCQRVGQCDVREMRRFFFQPLTEEGEGRWILGKKTTRARSRFCHEHHHPGPGHSPWPALPAPRWESGRPGGRPWVRPERYESRWPARERKDGRGRGVVLVLRGGGGGGGLLGLGAPQSPLGSGRVWDQVRNSTVEGFSLDLL